MAGKFQKNKPTFNEDIAKSKEYAKNNTADLVQFSFKYLTCKGEKFNYHTHSSDYFLMLLDRLKTISMLRAIDFVGNKSQALRAHPIKWDETTEICFSLPAEEQLVDTPYQFSLTSNEYGRVHGFIIGTNRFYIVWLDKHHELYPQKN